MRMEASFHPSPDAMQRAIERKWPEGKRGRNSLLAAVVAGGDLVKDDFIEDISRGFSYSSLNISEIEVILRSSR